MAKKYYGLQSVHDGSYWNNDFQTELKTVEQAMQVMGAPGDPADWRLEKLSKAEVEVFIPSPTNLPKTIEERLSDIEKILIDEGMMTP